MEEEAEVEVVFLLVLPKTGRMMNKAVTWANIIAGQAAKTQTPYWYTCVGMPGRKKITIFFYHEMHTV